MRDRWWATGSQRDRRLFWDDQPLGEVPDSELAESLGVPRELVYRQRHKRGIPEAHGEGVPQGQPNPSRRRRAIDWDAQPLGRVSDYELAKTLGVGSSTVHRKRQERGIPPLIEGKASKGTDYSKVPLGKLPDSEIAASLGLDPRSVADARKRRGITAYRKGYHERELSKSGVTLADLYAQPLGERPDSAIADIIGVSRSTVRWARRRVGIERHKPKTVSEIVKSIDWSGLPLGDVPDVQIGAAVGLHWQHVARVRVDMGITPRASGGAGAPVFTNLARYECVRCGQWFTAPAHFGAKHGGPKHCSSRCAHRSKWKSKMMRGLPPGVREARGIIYEVNSGLFWLRKQMREEMKANE